MLAFLPEEPRGPVVPEHVESRDVDCRWLEAAVANEDPTMLGFRLRTMHEYRFFEASALLEGK